MKRTLAWDKFAGQYRCDVGQPQHRFRLGTDPVEAAKRKDRLGILWQNVRRRGGWTEPHLEMAKAIAAGRAVRVVTTDSANPDADEQQAATTLEGIDTPIQPTARLTDYQTAMLEIQKQRIDELEKLVREQLGHPRRLESRQERRPDHAGNRGEQTNRIPLSTRAVSQTRTPGSSKFLIIRHALIEYAVQSLGGNSGWVLKIAAEIVLNFRLHLPTHNPILQQPLRVGNWDGMQLSPPVFSELQFHRFSLLHVEQHQQKTTFLKS